MKFSYILIAALLISYLIRILITQKKIQNIRGMNTEKLLMTIYWNLDPRIEIPVIHPDKGYCYYIRDNYYTMYIPMVTIDFGHKEKTLYLIDAENFETAESTNAVLSKNAFIDIKELASIQLKKDFWSKINLDYLLTKAVQNEIKVKNFRKTTISKGVIKN